MSAYSDLILAEPSLQSYWRLGETVGSVTVADSKGSVTGTPGSGITLGGASLLTSDALDTCALVVNVANGHIAFGDVYPFTGTATYSFEAWIKPDAAALSNNGFLVDNRSSGGADGWYLRVLAAGGIRSGRVLAAAEDQSQSADGLVEAGGRYHTLTTYDGSTLLVYLNGAQVATIGSSKVLTDPVSAFWVGESQPSGNRCSGLVDEVAVYNTNLSPSAILEHLSAGLASDETITVQYARGSGPVGPF
jgi:hypothetical protein